MGGEIADGEDETEICGEGVREKDTSRDEEENV